MKDVSIVVASIRIKNLEKMYAAIQKACKKHTFELVVIGPYKIPDVILKKENVTYIHSYLPPVAACQAAIRLCNAEFLYVTSDDGLIQEDTIDLAIQIFREKLDDKGIINMIYDEASLDVETLELIPGKADFPADYWSSAGHPELQIPGIEPNWIMALQFFMKLNYFYQLGGFDCNFEVLNYNLHDLVYRAQAYGSKVINLPVYALMCSHLVGHASDHGPVHDASVGPDRIKFYTMYMQNRVAYSRTFLYYDNWKFFPNVWERRFKDLNNLPLEKP